MTTTRAFICALACLPLAFGLGCGDDGGGVDSSVDSGADAGDGGMDTGTDAGGGVARWVSAADGTWGDDANWSTGAAPGEGDVAVIDLEGDYTVTLDGDVTVAELVLGAVTGTQVLATGDNALIFGDGALTGGAEIATNGMTTVEGNVTWTGGTLSGSGTVLFVRDSDVEISGDTDVELSTELRNSGVLTFASTNGLNLRGGRLDNRFDGVIDFRGDATLAAISMGEIVSDGVILRSAGTGDAVISTTGGATNTFTSTGRIQVDTGVLKVAGGELRGRIEIASGAMLRQTGTTTMPSTIDSRGDGVLEITGELVIGSRPGQSIGLLHVVLDSGSTLSGEGQLSIQESLVWRGGAITSPLFTHRGSMTTIETTDARRIDGASFKVAGTVNAGAMQIGLHNGGSILIEPSGVWNQSGGATISDGVGDIGAVTVLGTLNKSGTGSFTFESDFRCAGTMNVTEGVVSVEGAFLLDETGTFVGGGTDAFGNNVRLQVPMATSAVLAGTVIVDASGSTGRLDILGSVTLAPTFVAEVDVPRTGAIPTETLGFLTGGQVLAGTLDVTVASPPVPGDTFRVVSTTSATGAFDAIEGAEPFTGIVEDASGVLLTR